MGSPDKADPAPAGAKPALPDWAHELREKYLAGEASTFVLYRNVFDIYLIGGQFVDLKTFLTGAFVQETKSTVIEVSAEFTEVMTFRV